ncbi:MAG: tail fiber domain-containing protein [Ferruginibacter sp.]
MGTVLPAIMQLHPKTCHYKDNQSGDPLSYGFIAQEVEQLFPAFVTTKGPDGMKAIAYQNLIVVAIKTIQKL